MIKRSGREGLQICRSFFIAFFSGPGRSIAGLQSAESVAEKRTKRTTISEWVDNRAIFVIRFPRQIGTAVIGCRVRYDENGPTG